jgi:hypothetical protein
MRHVSEAADSEPQDQRVARGPPHSAAREGSVSRGGQEETLDYPASVVNLGQFHRAAPRVPARRVVASKIFSGIHCLSENLAKTLAVFNLFLNYRKTSMKSRG